MKFALHSVSYSGTWGGPVLSFEQFLDRARSFGYQGVEVMAKRPHISPVDYARRDDRRRLADMIAAKGLEVACIAGYHDWCWDAEHTDIPYQEQQLLWLMAECDLAADLNCPYVRTFSGYLHPEVPTKTHWDTCVSYLREAATYAASVGVTLVLQNHQGQTIHYLDVKRMIEEVNHPSLKMQLDPMYIHFVHETMQKAVEDCGDLPVISVISGHILRHSVVHANTRGSRGVWQPTFDIFAVPLDQADEDIRGLLAAYKHSGFKGPYIAYEVCGLPLLGRSIEVVDDLARSALQYLQETWDNA